MFSFNYSKANAAYQEANYDVASNHCLLAMTEDKVNVPECCQLLTYCFPHLSDPVLKRKILASLEPYTTQENIGFFAFSALGVIEMNQQNYSLAQNHFMNALLLQQDNYDMAHNYALSMYRQQNYIDCLDEIKIIRRKHGDNPKLCLFRAEVHKHLGQPLEALDCYRLAWEHCNNAVNLVDEDLINQVSYSYKTQLAFTAQRSCIKGNFTQALKYCRALLYLDPHDLKTLMACGMCNFQLGDYPQALFYYDRYLDNAPETEQLLVQMAKCYDKMNDTNNAHECIERAACHRPTQSLLFTSVLNRLSHHRHLYASTNDLNALETDSKVGLADQAIKVDNPEDNAPGRPQSS